jgi:hypothetical protein
MASTRGMFPVALVLAAALACGSDGDGSPLEDGSASGSTSTGPSSAPSPTTVASNDTTAATHATATGNDTGTAGGDSETSLESGGSTGGERLPPDPCIAANTCPPGEWIDVTPPELAALEFGPGPVVVDPRHASDLYMGGGGDGIWKSGDYGNTWARINDTIGYVPMGLILAVAGTEPATIWVAGYQVVYRSTDGGVSFESIAVDLPAELYSSAVDPYDDTHLISGLHEADGLVESEDSGVTWQIVGGNGFPGGGVSWYPFFLDTGDASGTRGAWFAIAQDGGSASITRDGGASWTTPSGIDGLQHPHGNAQIFQQRATVFAGGINGPGSGVYRSEDGGDSFTRVLDGNVGIVWGSPTHVYSMWGWACSGCDLGASFSVASLSGDDWSTPAVPGDLIIGANHMAVTSDGNHVIFVGTMWASGVWRYIEP